MRRNYYANRTYPYFFKLSLGLVCNCCALAVAVHGREFVLVVLRLMLQTARHVVNAARNMYVVNNVAF
jgi:hypothetical protein